MDKKPITLRGACLVLKIYKCVVCTNATRSTYGKDFSPKLYVPYKSQTFSSPKNQHSNRRSNGYKIPDFRFCQNDSYELKHTFSARKFNEIYIIHHQEI